MGMAGVSGSRWTKVRNIFKGQCRAADTPCHICHQPINWNAPPQAEDAFEPDHYYPRKTHPHLTYDIGNLRCSHSKCNRERRDTAMATGVWAQAEDWG